MISATVSQELVARNGMSKKSRNEPLNADTAGKLPHEIGTDYTFKRKIVWFNAFGFLLLHLAALIGVFLMFYASWFTLIWAALVGLACGQGITMGAHRLFAHKTFKARFIVKLPLLVLQTMSGQNCLYVWARDHRLHHKYSDTDADPHNSNRGFFFSHMGWLMSRKHPAVISKGKTIDMSDMEADPIIMFQKKYYKSLYIIFAICIPVTVPVYLWDETYMCSLFIAYFLRYIVSLHFTWLVNSAAHIYGTKPYDETMRPVESWLVSLASTGEGWHNYHHAFPWDYRASELGTKFNITTILIDILASIGLVYDLKSAPEHMVKHRCLKAGDGSHWKYGPMKIEKDLYERNKSNQEHVMSECDCFTEQSTLEAEALNKSNSLSKTDLEEDDSTVKEMESISEKDATTQEKTMIKRIVNDKHLLHG